MMNANQRLQEIAEMLGKGVVPDPVSVRDFLWWFRASRRGRIVVLSIRGALEKNGLETVPDFENTWIGNPIRFIVDGSEDGAEDASASTRIDALPSANRPPISIKPATTLDETITIMLTNEFSQLPVMTTEREVKGVVSWRSIGSRLALGRSCSTAQDCMDRAAVIPGDTSLFEAIDIVAKHDYVLVRAKDQTVRGIVTVSDLTEQFRDLAEPFLLIGEIENHLRRLIHGKFSTAELIAVKHPDDPDRQIESVSDLTFGEYVRLLENEERWSRLGLAIDRGEFTRLCSQVRDIRNDVMHFDPEGVDPEAMAVLRDVAKFLRALKRIGAI